MIFWNRYAMYMVTHLHFCPCPFIATAIGFPVIAAALAIYKRPSMLVGIASVAALFHWLVVPIQHVPIFTSPLTTYPYINPTIFIILSSIVFSLIASLVKRRLAITTRLLAGIGALSAMLSSIAWIHIVDLLGAPILTATGLYTPLAYLATNGVIWMAISTATLPLGYLAGLRLPLKISPLFDKRPWLYRLGPLMVVVLCWSVSIAVFAVGL